MKFEDVLEFLAQSQPVPTTLGIIVILLGLLLINRRRHIPNYQVQPAIMTIALGVGITILHPAMLAISMVPGF